MWEMNDKKSKYFLHSFLKSKEIVHTVWGVSQGATPYRVWGASQGATLLILAQLHRRIAPLSLKYKGPLFKKKLLFILEKKNSN